MNGMKYLVFTNGRHEHIVLFPAVIEHRAFAEGMPKEWKAVRGGSVWIMDEHLQCYGSSFSLGLESDPAKDTMLLKREIVV